MATAGRGLLLHNRLTHSLKVEQIGYSVSLFLGSKGFDIGSDSLYAIQAACLAHDLGHAPFGHAGEQTLHELVTCKIHRSKPRTFDERRANPCKDCTLEDGFEGNAQTLRIVSALELHRDDSQTEKHPPYGMDLTRLSLAAMTKYPWLHGALDADSRRRKDGRKWGAYDCDAATLDWVFDGVEGLDQTLEAQIMDWADDISYAVHDVEDFYRARLIPLNDYRANSSTIGRFVEYLTGAKHSIFSSTSLEANELIDAFTNLAEYFPETEFSGDDAHIVKLDEMRSRLITQFMAGLTLDSERKNLQIGELPRALNAILKQLTWFHIIDNDRLAGIQHGQCRVLRELYDDLVALARRAYIPGEKEKYEARRLPSGLRRAVDIGLRQRKFSNSPYTTDQVVVRGVVDYLASLTDSEVYSQHRIHKGDEQAGAFL